MGTLFSRPCFSIAKMSFRPSKVSGEIPLLPKLVSCLGDPSTKSLCDFAFGTAQDDICFYAAVISTPFNTYNIIYINCMIVGENQFSFNVVYPP